MDRIKADLVIENASQLLTCAEGARDRIGLIPNGWVAVKGDTIAAVGTREEVEARVSLEGTHSIDADGKVVAPGFIDCHTHLVFAGSRVEEYAARLQTNDPAELKRRGIRTGIMVSVEATRNATEEELFDQSAERLREMLLSGTTTVESKSGYGLSLESELRMLRVNRELERAFPVQIVSTFLGAHGWPADMEKNRYMEHLVRDMIPAVANEGLAEFCDIWCDDGHYDADECRTVLEAGRDAEMEPKIHTGAYSYVGGADLAAEMGMASADHLNFTPRKALSRLVDAGVPGVLLPGIDFAVRHPRPFDPRPMEEEGLTLALATNCCPGCWCTSMPLILQLGCRNHGLSPESAIRAATLGSAKALLRDRSIGSLETGKRADIQIWKLGRYEDAVYHLGSSFVETVIQRGQISVTEGQLTGKTMR